MSVDRVKTKMIMKRVNDLFEIHCTECNILKEFREQKKEPMSYCINSCPVGRKIRYYGLRLVPDKPVRWSEDEMFYIKNHMNVFSISHLAFRLNRPVEEVDEMVHKLKKEREEVLMHGSTA